MKAENITRLPAETLFDEMNRCHETGNHRTAVIVFKTSNWPGRDYSEECRSYRSHSNQWGWDYSKMGQCRIGDCLDGSDPGVRLDWMGWDVDYWYWENSK